MRAGRTSDIVVEWDDVGADEEGYRVRWGNESGPPYDYYADVGANVLTYTIQDQYWGDDLYWRVYALVDGVEQEPSVEVVLTVGSWAELTGAAAAASIGALSQSTSIALTGASVAAQSGTVTSGADTSRALSGAAASASAGQVVSSTSIALAGARVAAQAGMVGSGEDVTRALTGAAAAASIGSMGRETSIALTGLGASAVAGQLGLTLSIAVGGAAVQAAAGTLTALAGGPVTRALTGAAVAALAGTMRWGLVQYGRRASSLNTGSASRPGSYGGSRPQ
jgi:hypothetical protein